MNKKVVIIILVVVLLLCLVCSACLGITYLGMKKVFEEGIVIKEQMLGDLCETGSTMSEADYEQWFTEDFKAKYSYIKATDSMSEIFPASYDCNTLLEGDLLEMLSQGQAVSISSVNGAVTAQITFNNGSSLVVIYLEQSGSTWKIDEISTTSTL